MIGNIPDGWRVKKLSECGKIITGKTPSKTVKEYWNSNDISFIKPDDFTKNSIIEFDKGKDFVSYKGFEKNPTIPPYSVLTTCIGNIGKVLINKNEATSNQQINSIVPNQDIDYKFLAYSILNIKPIMLQRANAPVVPMINKTDFGKYTIPIPPLPQQEKIVKVLDISSQLIEKQKELIEEYDLFLKSKFIEMFGDPIKNPMEWEVVKLGLIIEILTDYHANGSYEILRKHVELLDKKDYALMIRTTDLEKNNFEDNVKYISESAYEFLTKTKVYGQEIIMNKIGSAGSIYLMPTLNIPVSLGMNQFLIRLNKSCNSVFLYNMLQTDYGKKNIEKQVRGAVTKSITKDAVRDILMPLPPIELQNKFASIVEKIEIIKNQETQKLEHLETLHNSLMDKAFKGEI
ncbi:MAG: restriction endonuclease subunit S [Sulfurimonas sp.]|nr:restriction endonuclease subunit S [Sulfurimonas sp.]